MKESEWDRWLNKIATQRLFQPVIPLWTACRTVNEFLSLIIIISFQIYCLLFKSLLTSVLAKPILVCCALWAYSKTHVKLPFKRHWCECHGKMYSKVADELIWFPCDYLLFMRHNLWALESKLQWVMTNCSLSHKSGAVKEEVILIESIELAVGLSQYGYRKDLFNIYLSLLGYDHNLITCP